MASNMPTTPQSNVTPLWGGSPPSWPSTAVPPGCFSELARLNQCYNEVQMMEMILSKVVCDLATNNVAFQQCLVDAIAKSGSNVPLIGVTNGADAQPGQVGQWVTQYFTGAVTGATNQVVLQSLTLQPGDWDFWCVAQTEGQVNDAQFTLNPTPAGLAGSIYTYLALPGTSAFLTVVSTTCRMLTAVPVLMPFQLTFNSVGAGPGATNYSFTFSARRTR